MIVVTYSYTPETHGMKRMRESVERQGYELAVVKTKDSPKQAIKDLFECYKRAATGHDFIVYADYADSYFQRRINVPSDHVLYSTEKNCFPFPEWANRFNSDSRWRFLNGGGYCGPSKLVVEFYDRYNLHSIGSKNPQAAQMEAYFQGVADGFPIKLDTQCKIFQSVAFEFDDEFEMEKGLLRNKITKSVPSILHGNGLTPLEKFIQ